MLQLHIENAQLYINGRETELERVSLGDKVKEVLRYMLRNNIIFDLEKRERHISFSPLRPDLKNRLINALMAERLILHHTL